MSEATTLGQRLSAAREQKGLSAQRAADELHLDGWVIQGLESGDYARIGPDVYAKGHLKRYATLLGLSVAEVSAAFDGKPSTADMPAPTVGMRGHTSAAGDRWSRPQLTGAVIVAVTAAVIMAGVWWSRHQTRIAATQAALAAAVAAPAAPRTGTSANGTLPMASTAEDEAEPAAAAGRARLRLSFLGDSWADVHDAAGQRLFAGEGHLHNVRSLSGAAPFRVYLKAADSIRMEINGHVVVIEPKFVVANVARFEVGADGVLRRDPRVPASGAAGAPGTTTATPGAAAAPGVTVARPRG